MDFQYGLGLRPPTDDKHLVKYPMLLAATPPEPTPGVLGIEWFEGFTFHYLTEDSIGRFFIREDALDINHGNSFGGHAIMSTPTSVEEPKAWWPFYDQGRTSACVGFSTSRMMGNLNRKRYRGDLLYQRAKEVDDWPGEDYDGTSLRAGFDVLRDEGPFTANKKPTQKKEDGIAANRWARNVDDILRSLGAQGREYFALRNSWGEKGWPVEAFMPASVVDKLMSHGDAYCEYVIPTDR